MQKLPLESSSYAKFEPQYPGSNRVSITCSTIGSFVLFRSSPFFIVRISSHWIFLVAGFGAQLKCSRSPIKSRNNLLTSLMALPPDHSIAGAPRFRPNSVETSSGLDFGGDSYKRFNFTQNVGTLVTAIHHRLWCV